MTLSDFSQLKHQVVRTVAASDSHSDHLLSLKELFRGDINSVRRFEKICNIGQLLHVLELRGLLSEDNVEPLKIIARKLNSNELLRKVNNYEDCHIPREYENYYVSEKEHKTLSSETLNQQNKASTFEFQISINKKNRMIKTVVEEIGIYWRDLGRTLQVRECVIDYIDHNHKTLATKALRMMEKFDSKVNQQKWFFVLCDALDKIHRKDLVHSLQEIIMMNI